MVIFVEAFFAGQRLSTAQLHLNFGGAPSFFRGRCKLRQCLHHCEQLLDWLTKVHQSNLFVHHALFGAS